MHEDAAQEAVKHLRAAALELIAAARAMLDMTEDMVKDPGPLLGLVAALATAVKPETDEDADPAGNRPRVEHIRVS